MRPPGYEPGELPTAPLRDIDYLCISWLRVQSYEVFGKLQNFSAEIFSIWCNIDLYQWNNAVFVDPNRYLGLFYGVQKAFDRPVLDNGLEEDTAASKYNKGNTAQMAFWV